MSEVYDDAVKPTRQDAHSSKEGRFKCAHVRHLPSSKWCRRAEYCNMGLCIVNFLALRLHLAAERVGLPGAGNPVQNVVVLGR